MVMMAITTSNSIKVKILFIVLLLYWKRETTVSRTTRSAGIS